MATRTITIKLYDATADQYVRIANGVWAAIDMTDVEGGYNVYVDNKASLDQLNAVYHDQEPWSPSPTGPTSRRRPARSSIQHKKGS